MTEGAQFSFRGTVFKLVHFEEDSLCWDVIFIDFQPSLFASCKLVVCFKKYICFRERYKQKKSLKTEKNTVFFVTVLKALTYKKSVSKQSISTSHKPVNRPNVLVDDTKKN